MTDADLSALIDAALHGTITTAEWGRLQERLRTDPAARTAYRRAVNLHCALGRAFAGARPEPEPPAQPPPKYRKRIVAVAALSALAVAVAVAVWLPRGAPPDPTETASGPAATLVQADVGSEFLAPGGQSRPAVGGESIPTGHGIRTGTEAGPVVIAVGSSRIELAADSTMRFDREPESETVFLPVGVARVELVPGRDGHTAVRTPHARIRASRTAFVSAVSADATLIEVESGRLELTRATDGQTVELGPGAWAVVSADGPMVSRPPFARQAALAGTLKTAGRAVALSPDGATVAVATATAVEVWDLRERRPTTTLATRVPVTALAFAPDGRALAIGGNAPFVQLWNFAATKAVAEFEPGDRAEKSIGATFAGDGKWLAATGHRGITVGVRVWEAVTGRSAPVPASAARGISVVGVPGGALLAAGNRDGTVAVWNAETGREEAVLKAGPKEPIKAVAASADGRRLAHPVQTGIAIWNVEQRRLERTLDGQDRWFASSVAFSPDGKFVAAGGPTDVLVWDVETGHAVATVPTRGGTAWLAFTADGRGLLTHSGGSAPVRIWTLPTAE